MLSSNKVNPSEGRNEAQNNHISVIIPMSIMFLSRTVLFPVLRILPLYQIINNMDLFKSVYDS